LWYFESFSKSFIADLKSSVSFLLLRQDYFAFWIILCRGNFSKEPGKQFHQNGTTILKKVKNAMLKDYC